MCVFGLQVLPSRMPLCAYVSSSKFCLGSKIFPFYYGVDIINHYLVIGAFLSE